MESFASVFIIIGMFALRICVPIAVIAGLVYVLKRLDRRWEEEARLERQAQVRPARAVERVAAPARPAALPLAARPLPGIVPVAAGKPCWEVKHCSSEKMKSCAAVQHPEMACWQARLQADGFMPEACTTCEVFERYPMM